jgi:hypothetical protein
MTRPLKEAKAHYRCKELENAFDMKRKNCITNSYAYIDFNDTIFRNSYFVPNTNSIKNSRSKIGIALPIVYLHMNQLTGGYDA